MFEHWPYVEWDLFDTGVDLGNPEILRGRSWRWLRERVYAIFSADRGYRGHGGTRVQRVLWPPKNPAKQAQPDQDR